MMAPARRMSHSLPALTALETAAGASMISPRAIA
jgi:hypothetical protein